MLKRVSGLQEIEFVFKTYGAVTDVHVIAGDSHFGKLMHSPLHCCTKRTFS